MKYYVPVGRGGVFFRLGMIVVGTMGSMVYWRASRRRAATIRLALVMASGQSAAVSREPQTGRGAAAGSRGERVAVNAGTER